MPYVRARQNAADKCRKAGWAVGAVLRSAKWRVTRVIVDIDSGGIVLSYRDVRIYLRTLPIDVERVEEQPAEHRMRKRYKDSPVPAPREAEVTSA